MRLRTSDHRPARAGRRTAATVSLAAGLAVASGVAAAPAPTPHEIETATPIKHVIIIVGENRSFDHLFATYVPANPAANVLNLLSERIVRADGTPGNRFATAHQYRIASAPT